MDVCVVALGKIGLPLAVQFAGSGHQVVGVDTDPRVVELVASGAPPFPGEAELDERLTAVLASGALTVTTDTAAAVGASAVVVVVVPLVVTDDGAPNFAGMDAAAGAIGRGLRTDTLVCFETTLPVGTTRDRLTPALARASGLEPGVDFFVAFSPERVSSGRIFADLRRYPKLVGGIDDASERRAAQFYAEALQFDDRPDLDRPNGVWGLGSAEAAELAKLAETTYRDVNIGLANQFALHAEALGVDIHAVIEAANSQPFSHIHRPGISVGGHCIPVYPHLYLAGDPAATVVRAARAANASMPARVVEALERLHGSLAGTRVAVLGLAYRGGVKETAFSGTFPTVAALLERGASVAVHDPLYTDDELRTLDFEPYRVGSPVDAVVIHTDHAAYSELTPADFPGVRTLVDGRGITEPDRWDGVRRHVVGDGSTRAR